MSDARGSRIGPYLITGVLGEGGGGVVYRAEQSEPVQREVALKVLRDGADSEQVVARFGTERQALAVMDHPSIAKVFDAGVSDDGRPYFVMELVAGTSLSEFCDVHRLTVRERVALFVDLCNAVQHAHQKGVIHRDLKPSNVLVAEVDGRPLPRIIDFGIAKATGEGVFDGTKLTRDDQAIGTPAYMSPEQIDGSGDVDTRTDIYALGVMLFEILVGSLPYDREAYRGWAAVAAQFHREPPTLAARLAELDDTQETIAALRSTTLPVLRRELAGDLGWIVSRAMEKDRERRYETSNALALDLTRFLDHEPVRARGATTAYVVRKFVRRNRLGVAFGATAAMGLLTFAVVTSAQANRIAQARDEAEARRGQAEGLVDFMLGDLRDKLEPIGRLDVLDDVGEQATRYFGSIPEEQFSDEELESRSQALYQIGDVRLDQGDSQSAVGAFTESLRLARALSERAPDDLDRLFGLSQSYFWVGYASYLRDDLEVAEEQFLGYLDAAERLVALAPDNLDYRLELGFAHGNLGSVREARGDLTGAADAYSLTLDVKRSLVEMEPANIDRIGELAESHNKLGVVLRKAGSYAAALEQHTREFELRQAIAEMDPQHAYWRERFAVALGFFAEVMMATGELDESLALRTRQVALLDSLVGADPSNTVRQRNRASVSRARGGLLVELGRFDEAEHALDLAEREMRRLVAADSTAFGWHADLAWVLAVKTALHLDRGSPGDALESATTAVALLRDEVPQTTSRATVVARAHLARGNALDGLGRSGEAREAWALAVAVLAPHAAAGDQSELRPLMAELLLRLDRPEDASRELQVLRSSGYVDRKLDALASRKGAPG